MNDRDIEDTRQPKDEPEAVYCDSCGQEKEVIHDWDGAEDFRCRNKMCPSRFNHGSIEREMAEALVDALDTVSRLKSKVASIELRLKRWEDAVKHPTFPNRK